MNSRLQEEKKNCWENPKAKPIKYFRMHLKERHKLVEKQLKKWNQFYANFICASDIFSALSFRSTFHRTLKFHFQLFDFYIYIFFQVFVFFLKLIIEEMFI